MSKTTPIFVTVTRISTLSVLEQIDIKGGLMATTCEEKRPKIRT